jgi:SAM-dependent methyltransferase
MRINKYQYFSCPSCGEDLELVSEDLVCKKCNSAYPVIKGIPRFVDGKNYASSFGMQWKLYSKTQLDKFNGTTISKDRFYEETGWASSDLRGKKVLECGSGAGRFTQVVLDSGAICFSFDYSNAVEANQSNNLPNDNLILAQADIYRIPFKKKTFDYIFCMGVLQHTPDPEKAFLSMTPYLKDGGKIVVDAYTRSFKAFIQPKYALRLLSVKISQKALYKIVKISAPHLFFMSCMVKKIPFLGNFLSKFVPVANYKGILPLPDNKLLEWAILDTFDWLSPRYDHPQTKYSLKKYFLEAGLVNIQICHKNGLIGRGTAPLSDKK